MQTCVYWWGAIAQQRQDGVRSCCVTSRRHPTPTHINTDLRRLQSHVPTPVRDWSVNLRWMWCFHEVARFKQRVDMFSNTYTSACCVFHGKRFCRLSCHWFCLGWTTATPSHVISRLQSVLNASTRLLFSLKKYDHVTPILQELIWLKMNEWIEYKLAVLGSGVAVCVPRQQSPVCLVHRRTTSSTLRVVKNPRHPVNTTLHCWRPRSLRGWDPVMDCSLSDFVTSASSNGTLLPISVNICSFSFPRLQTRLFVFSLFLLRKIFSDISLLNSVSNR